MSSSLYVITNTHYMVFGRIVQQFARFERWIEICVARSLGQVSLGKVTLIISGLSYSAKCDALKSILYVQDHLLFDHREEIEKIVDGYNKYSSLRNNIAHHVWDKGARPNSVRPLSVTSRGGKPKFRGLADEDKDYTLDELIDISDELVDAYANAIQYTNFIGVTSPQQD